jgi:L-phenylalanine/L-methionine N-acetyltransferase
MFTVREATVADATSLVAHLTELAAEPGINIPLSPDEIASVEHERAILEDFAQSPRAIMLIAQAAGALVGELSLRAISSRRAVAHVGTLGMSVKAAWRRKGVGKELLTAALEFAPTAAIRRIELYVYARNTPAIELYQRFGFEVEGRRKGFIREGDSYLDDLVMARLL